MLPYVDWSRKIGPTDPQWTIAEMEARRLANETGSTYISGRGIAAPWIVNRRSDRVVAYHGFAGGWVGWERGGVVLPIPSTDEAIKKFILRQ